MLAIQEFTRISLSSRHDSSIISVHSEVTIIKTWRLVNENRMGGEGLNRKQEIVGTSGQVNTRFSSKELESKDKKSLYKEKTRRK